MNKSFSIAFYNVENLFDIFNNLIKYDDDYTSKAPKKWNKSRYELKLKNISRVISEIGFEETQNAPLIIGLAEIENDKVLKDLIEQENLKKYNYGFCHFNSKDERGIDVAILYQKDFINIIETKKIEILLSNEQGKIDFTRDILYCKILFQEQFIHFYTVHLPSKRENDINLLQRIKIIKELKQIINNINLIEKNPYICICGDFNENPNHELFKNYLNTGLNPNELNIQKLFNPFELLFENRMYSLVYKNQGLLFDQIIFSKKFTDSNSDLIHHYSKIFSPYYIQNYNSKSLGQPLRTYIGNRYIGGFSDHFPVYSIIKSKNQILKNNNEF